MGALREQTIPTLFAGVSRQPHPVRFPGQVQDAENVEFSVETGGFSKRLGLRLRKKLTGLSTGVARNLHIINRDTNEKYRVVLSNGSVKVYDKDYVEKTVNALSADATTFISSTPSNFSLLTVLDYTFIVKKTMTVTMDGSNVAPDRTPEAVVYVAQSWNGSGTSNYSITINGNVEALYAADNTKDTFDIAKQLVDDLIAHLNPTLWDLRRRGSYIFIKKKNLTDFTITHAAPFGDTGMITYKDSVSAVTKAPARANNGMILQVKGVTNDGYWIKFDADEGGDGAWKETVEPGSVIKFDAKTMPWRLVRESNGTFTLSPNSWKEKKVGGADEIPNPDFVGTTIQDVLFTRNRLGLVAGETVYFAAAGDVFNFWPETSTQIIDSDPFGLTNSTDSVSRFYYAVPFRRSVFVMADNAQFEIGGKVFTPGEASIDLATSYEMSTLCRPVACGDELYFPVETGGVQALLAYTYQESSVSETASDVSRHVQGFVPSPVVQLAADPVQGAVFCLSSSDRDALYVHKFFYQGNDRVQSSWSRYQFDGVTIRSIAMLNGVLQLIVEYGGSVWLAELPMRTDDLYADFSWVPRLDMNQLITGTYNAGTNRTTWDLGYAPTDPVVITSNQFPSTDRMLSLPLTVANNTVYTTGNYSAYPCMCGENFSSFVELSRQFVRDEQGTSIINGRLQLRTMSLNYAESGYFTVDITPEGRDPLRYTYTGRTLGSSSNAIQMFGISDGAFKFVVGSNGATTKIVVGSDKFLPFTITSAAWVGFFNEISRQG